MPAISVIVPVYQAEALLPQCVESVLAQTFSDWELLLIDDGSRDGSPTLCDGYAARDPRIRVFHKPNGGVSTARNLGLEQATGPYIAFLDADDTFEPAALETLWYLREKAGADSAGCAHYNVTPDGERRTEMLLPTGIYEETGIREKILWPLAGDRLQPLPTLCWPATEAGRRQGRISPRSPPFAPKTGRIPPDSPAYSGGWRRRGFPDSGTGACPSPRDGAHWRNIPSGTARPPDRPPQR